MTILRQLDYTVLDLQGSIVPTESNSISLRVNECTPKYLIHKALVIHFRNNRQGTASCKTRSDVRGGGKKPWKQKGTGQARSGSSNSPLWKGGGVTFGPKPRSYEKKLNIKERHLALRTAFYYNMHKLLILGTDFTEISEPKTKSFVSLLNRFLKLDSKTEVLIVTHLINSKLNLCIRNIPNVRLSHVSNLNLTDLLSVKHILITHKALTHFTETI